MFWTRPEEHYESEQKSVVKIPHTLPTGRFKCCPDPLGSSKYPEEEIKS